MGKSHVLASSPGLRAELSRIAVSEGCEFSAALAARDLGHDAALGARRTVAVRQTRFTKGRDVTSEIFSFGRTC
eukprot:2460252-Pyramimonas_sp.AAC.1